MTPPPDTGRTLLRRRLIDHYASLKRRLTNRLGSETLASEALNETWLRLGQGGELEEIANADAYLFRAALYTASSLRRRDSRTSSHFDVADLTELEDEAPRADRVIGARHEIAQLMTALAELPPRQRTAFLECFRGDRPPEDLAVQYQVSVRTIQADIRSAILHCAERLGRKNILAGKRVKHSRD